MAQQKTSNKRIILTKLYISIKSFIYHMSQGTNMLCALSKSTKTFATRSCFAGPIDIKIHANMYFMSICPLAHHIQGKKCIEYKVEAKCLYF